MLHTCTPYCRHDPARPRVRGAHAELTIDFHCHLLDPRVEQLVDDAPARLAERTLQRQVLGVPSVEHNERTVMPVAARRMSSLEERLADMDAMGVDVQVLSPSPTQYHYWAEPALAERICDLQNENLAAQCARHADRFRALGAVALQHPELAARQVRHCVRSLGFAGVEISSMAGGRELADPALAPFWQAAEEVDAVVFLHPLGTTLGTRLDTHYLSNIIGQPLETTIALSKLILGGMLDRHPGLRLLAAHGGGYLPAYVGRLDHGAQVRPEAGGAVHTPSSYLRRIWFDTVVYDPRVLRHLIETVGVSQLVVGTDYPYDMGDYDVHALVAAIPGLTAEERRRILGGNAAQLLGMAQADGHVQRRTGR